MLVQRSVRVLFLILFISITYLFALDNLNTFIPLPELSELNYDYAELQNWQMPLDTLSSDYGINISKAESRCNWLPQTKQLTNRLLLSTSQSKIVNNSSLNGVFYQKLKRGEDPINRGQIGLFNNYPPLHLFLAIGNYRLQAGEGLCLGRYQTSQYNQQELIYPAQGLSHPALTGIAAKVNLLNTDIVLWMSQTKRLARIDNGQITTLYESSLSTYTNKDNVMESTDGIIANYAYKQHNIGAYYYSQSHNYSFSDSTAAKVKHVPGLYAEARCKPYIVGIEAVSADYKIAKALRFEYHLKDFHQSLHYFYRPQLQAMSYAKTEQVFGQKTGCEELSWDIEYQCNAHLSLIGRMAMVKDIAADTDIHWKERLILSAIWHNHDMQTGLTYYRFRKDAIPVFDTLQTDILPMQNRLKGSWKQKLAKDLDYSISCQYNHYRDNKLSQNGIMLNQTLNCRYARADFALSFLIWSNQKNYNQSSELLDNEDYLAQAETDSAFKVNVKYLLFNKYRLSIQSYIPVKHTGTQSYNCSISAAL